MFGARTITLQSDALQKYKQTKVEKQNQLVDALKKSIKKFLGDKYASAAVYVVDGNTVTANIDGVTFTLGGYAYDDTYFLHAVTKSGNGRSVFSLADLGYLIEKDLIWTPTTRETPDAS